MKKALKKLALHRETLHLIASPELSRVAAASGNSGCVSYCVDCNSAGIWASRCPDVPCQHID